MRASRLLPIVLRSVITGARLHVVIGVIGLNFDAAEAAVASCVRGRVADGILIAQFFLNFFEDFVERMLIAYGENVAAGFVRNHLRHR